MLEEETANTFEKACAKLTSDEMTVMVRRALAVYQASVESKPKLKKVELPPIDVRLEGPATYLTEEGTRIRLQAGAAGLPGVKLAPAVSNLGHTGNTGFRGEPRRCYRCSEVGYLKQTCPRPPPKERDTGGKGQSGSRGCGRGGRRGGRGGNQTHLMVAEEEEEVGEDLTEEDQALVKAYSQGLRNMLKLMGDVKSVRDDASTCTSSSGNFVSLAHTATGTHDTFALASIPTTRSPDWIVDSGASRHVTGTVREFSSYTYLAVSESVQIADGMAQPVVGKGIVKCTDSVTLANVLHAPSFPVNLVSISAIICEQKCIMTFDIPKMVF